MMVLGFFQKIVSMFLSVFVLVGCAQRNADAPVANDARRQDAMYQQQQRYQFLTEQGVKLMQGPPRPQQPLRIRRTASSMNLSTHRGQRPPSTATDGSRS